MLDSQESSAPDSRGIVIFNNLTITTHRLVVRRNGYSDYSMVFTPVEGNNTPLNVTLEPLPGVLQVKPSVEKASIEIKRLDGQYETINFIGPIDKLEVPPGDYQVTISKNGFKTVVRDVTIAPAHSSSLEPQLEPVEPPKRPAPERRVITIPITSTVEASGKFFIVRIRGASGQTAHSGSIDVVAPNATTGLLDIKGSLSGSPCEIEFVRMQNVAEASLVETPGPSNQWATVVIRVRPKDLKRLVHFVINWRSLEKSAATATLNPNQERRQ
jgi:PEGA domain